MIGSIGSRCGASFQPSPAHRSVATSRVRVDKESSSLKLTLRTDEGDTVEISLDAQSTYTSERSRARTAEGSGKSASESQSSSVTGSVKVSGDLSDKEIADIKKLLSSLASGDAPQADSSDSIAAYNYSYRQSKEVTLSKVKLYA